MWVASPYWPITAICTTTFAKTCGIMGRRCCWDICVGKPLHCFYCLSRNAAITRPGKERLVLRYQFSFLKRGRADLVFTCVITPHFTFIGCNNDLIFYHQWTHTYTSVSTVFTCNILEKWSTTVSQATLLCNKANTLLRGQPFIWAFCTQDDDSFICC